MTTAQQNDRSWAVYKKYTVLCAELCIDAKEAAALAQTQFREVEDKSESQCTAECYHFDVDLDEHMVIRPVAVGTCAVRLPIVNSADALAAFCAAQPQNDARDFIQLLKLVHFAQQVPTTESVAAVEPTDVQLDE